MDTVPHRSSPPGAGGATQGATGRYLEAAYYLEQEGEQVRPGKLAEWLGVSPPSVSEAVRRLERDGLVVLDPTHRIELTSLGRALASNVVRRHRVLEVWLTEVLGLDWVEADREAHQLAPALSEEVLDRLQHSLGEPSTCPHGNLIPGTQAPERSLQPLEALAPDQPARIARISELAEHEAPSVLTFLYEAGLIPGERIEVVSPLGPGGVLTVRLASRRLEHLSAEVARVVWVETGAESAAPQTTLDP